ncbi:MAG: membrane protein insertase YidC [Ardenticatenales bacterium]|nr:membrane protein insertase YidC [Ardenticatenales bacterium]
MWDWFVGLIVDALELFHGSLGDNWGLAIILFTVAIKVVTWPLTSKQIKSSKIMQEMQPKMKAIQEKFKDDKEAQSREMMKLYQEAGTNPVMGCLPMLIQFPVWIGLYQAILKLAADKQLDGGFLFLPSLAFPNNDLSWLTDFASYGQNWVYFILPILTVLTQVAISRFMTPPTTSNQNSDDPSVMMMKQMTTIMPLMFGVFALQFPAGLALYWVTNNILTGVQYAVVNRQGTPSGGDDSPFNGQVIEHPVAPSRPKQRAVPLIEAAGQTVMETPVESTDYSKEPSKDGKSRRKRKKR